VIRSTMQVPAVRQSERPSVRPKVALINSIVARHDAISAAVLDTYRCLTQGGEYDVSLFCYKNEYNDVASHIVSSVDELLLHRDYLDADIIFWHFGIYYELFNAVLIGNGHGLSVARFHNVTPKEFTSREGWELIERSLTQCHLLRLVDEVWADSTVNAAVAKSFGVDPDKTRTIPLVVEENQLLRLEDKSDSISILFVGRFVKSKGVLELLMAVDNVSRSGTSVPIAVTLVGNVEFSDPSYIAAIHAFIQRRALGNVVTMRGTVDEPTLHDLYRNAHILAIPSYHEGFCKPVIEALQAGCIPVGFSAYNLPFITNGFGRLVTPGDVDGLGVALHDVIEALPKAIQSPSTPRLPLDKGMTSAVSFTTEVRLYVEQFSANSVGTEMRERLRELLAVPTLSALPV